MLGAPSFMLVRRARRRLWKQLNGISGLGSVANGGMDYIQHSAFLYALLATNWQGGLKDDNNPREVNSAAVYIS